MQTAAPNRRSGSALYSVSLVTMRSSTAVIVALRGPPWKSRGLVRSRPARGRRHGSPGDDRIDLLFAATAPARVSGASVTFEPGAHGLAHPSPRPDLCRHGRHRPGTAGGWPDPGDQGGRCRVISARREALARRLAERGDDAHRHPGAARWQGG
jgi:hypothetical protein